MRCVRVVSCRKVDAPAVGMASAVCVAFRVTEGFEALHAAAYPEEGVQ